MVFHGCIDTVVVILSDWSDASAEITENLRKWTGFVCIRLPMEECIFKQAFEANHGSF